MRAPATRIALALSLTFVACGGTAAPRTVEATQFNASLNVDLKSSTRLPNGEYYRDLVVGNGAPATAGQTLIVHYTGWLSNGSQFGSNAGSAVVPFVLGAGEVIAGWDQGFDGARVGGTRQLIIPPGLAYGQAGKGPVPPDAVLVFSVQLEPVATVETTQFSPSLKVDLASSLVTADGEYYRDLVVGTGAPVAPGQTLAVHYTGWLPDGTQFDSNAGTSAFSFVLGARQVISGWDQGFAGAHVGGTRQLIIPPGLGYGLRGFGPVPPNAVLVFDVQIDSAR